MTNRFPALNTLFRSPTHVRDSEICGLRYTRCDDGRIFLQEISRKNSVKFKDEPSWTRNAHVIFSILSLTIQDVINDSECI